MMLTIEDLFAGAGFADQPASPLQLAICRAAVGQPLGNVLSREELDRYFGTADVPAAVPQLVVLVAGVRGGKTFLAACAAIAGCLRADCSRLKRYEVPRFAIIAPRTDVAGATFAILLGIIRNSPVLARMVEGEPTTDTIVLRRPDGIRVEIVVVAASSGGVTVRNRWMTGAVLEEVAQFGAEATGAAVNAEEILRAAQTRLLPGAQAWLISSPYGPQGLLHALWKRHFGKPGAVLVVHAPTRAMNPSFPQATIDAIARDNPDVAAREYMAEWVDADSAYFESALVDAATRAEPLILPPGAHGGIGAGTDAGTRGNAWTLALAWKDRSRTIVGGCWQWTGSKASPLSPKAVWSDIATICRRYLVNVIAADGWSFDANRDFARAEGLQLVEARSADRDSRYQALRALLASGSLELPPDPVVRSDLLGVRKVATSSSVKIVLPRTADGRHCDHAPAIAIAIERAKRGAAAVSPRHPVTLTTCSFEDTPIGIEGPLYGEGTIPEPGIAHALAARIGLGRGGY